MITLTADGNDVKLNPFSSRILENTLKGALTSLRGGENLAAALLRVENGAVAALTINGARIEVNEFVDSFLSGIVVAAAAALRDTEGTKVFEFRIS